jgi:hypothetical protein
MTQSRSQWLRKAIKKILLPELERLGFECRPLNQDEKQYREAIVSMPFGRHFRKMSEGGHVLEIEMGKRDSSQFRICFGFFPNEGVFGESEWDRGIHYPVETARVNEVSRQIFLGRKGTKGADFRVWYWPWQKPKKEDYEKLVQDVVELLPQIDAALNTGTIGPNIYSVDVSKFRKN